MGNRQQTLKEPLDLAEVDAYVDEFGLATGCAEDATIEAIRYHALGYKNRYDSAVQELEELRQTHEALKSDHEALQREHDDMKDKLKELEVLRQTHEALKSDYEALQREHDDMKDKLKEISRSAQASCEDVKLTLQQQPTPARPAARKPPPGDVTSDPDDMPEVEGDRGHVLVTSGRAASKRPSLVSDVHEMLLLEHEALKKRFAIQLSRTTEWECMQEVMNHERRSMEEELVHLRRQLDLLRSRSYDMPKFRDGALLEQRPYFREWPPAECSNISECSNVNDALRMKYDAMCTDKASLRQTSRPWGLERTCSACEAESYEWAEPSHGSN